MNCDASVIKEIESLSHLDITYSTRAIEAWAEYKTRWGAEEEDNLTLQDFIDYINYLRDMHQERFGTMYNLQISWTDFI